MPATMVMCGCVYLVSCATLLVRPTFTLMMSILVLAGVLSSARGMLTRPPKPLVAVRIWQWAVSVVVSTLPAAAPFIDFAMFMMY